MPECKWLLNNLRISRVGDIIVVNQPYLDIWHRDILECAAAAYKTDIVLLAQDFYWDLDAYLPSLYVKAVKNVDAIRNIIKQMFRDSEVEELDGNIFHIGFWKYEDAERAMKEIVDKLQSSARET